MTDLTIQAIFSLDHQYSRRHALRFASLGRDDNLFLNALCEIARVGDNRAMNKPIKIPGPDHTISIARNSSRVIVKVSGRVIADTKDALTLREAGYSQVQYIPRKDVDMSQLVRTDHHTYCPYKGDCTYYSIPAGGPRSLNAVWTYEAPYLAVAAIKDHLAFYPSRVDTIEEG